MRCPHCGRDSTDPTPPCPQCPDARQALTSASGTPTVVEPEILHAEDTGRQAYSHTTQDGARFTFTSWNFGGVPGGSFTARDSCLPGCITLFLLGVCTVQFGFLAAVGFLFFYLVGSGATAVFRLQQMMRGKVVNPWLTRIPLWILCWLLVGWLSGEL